MSERSPKNAPRQTVLRISLEPGEKTQTGGQIKDSGTEGNEPDRAVEPEDPTDDADKPVEIRPRMIRMGASDEAEERTQPGGQSKDSSSEGKEHDEK